MSKTKKGWQCPICGVIYAPTVEKCEAHKYADQYIPVYPYAIPWWADDRTAPIDIDRYRITIAPNTADISLRAFDATYTTEGVSA